MSSPMEAEPTRVVINIVEQDLLTPDPDVVGYLKGELQDDGGVRLTTIVRPGSSPEIKTMFHDWCMARVLSSIEIGPERDGWLQVGDNTWHLWCRLHHGMPDMSFLDETDPAGEQTA